MTPTNEVIQYRYQNPDASSALFIPMLVICNTSDEELERNIRINSVRNHEWLQVKPEHEGIAVFIGGGASIEDEIETIRALKEQGATVFAMNAASQWAREYGIEVDYQVIADAKQETSNLVDPLANWHLIASQCHPDTLEKVGVCTLWHLEIGNVEAYFPPERVKKGGYVLIGGGASVGNSALCIAYSQGFRNLHVFGYDSSYKNGRSHAYDQPMNKIIPTVDVTWSGKEYTVSVAMKAQAEKFQLTSHALKQAGCKMHVYGEGLLQTMYHTRPQDMTEQEKYQTLWQFDAYRDFSPGEQVAEKFLEICKPDGLVIDFGCGTGRGSLKIHESGLDVLLIDFTDNCRDLEAQKLPFLQWDLSLPCPAKANWGFCTDVMEHIPTDMIDAVIGNIMAAADNVFFQISTVPDSMGDLIEKDLHLTVKPFEWWADKFRNYSIEWSDNLGHAAMFYVRSNQ